MGGESDVSCDEQEIPTFQRESTEFLAIAVTKDNGDPIVTGVLVCSTGSEARPDPGDWVAAMELDGKIGLMVGPDWEPGAYRAWAKITSTPETVVLDCGLFRVV